MEGVASTCVLTYLLTYLLTYSLAYLERVQRVGELCVPAVLDTAHRDDLVEACALEQLAQLSVAEVLGAHALVRVRVRARVRVRVRASARCVCPRE